MTLPQKENVYGNILYQVLYNVRDVSELPQNAEIFEAMDLEEQTESDLSHDCKTYKSWKAFKR